MRKMVDYVNRKSLQLCMLSGMRFMECKRLVMDLVGESRCIGAYPDQIEELEGIVEENVQFDKDYDEYAEKMKAAGLK